MSDAGKAVVWWHRPEGATVNLLCLPWVGAGASQFRNWGTVAAETVPDIGIAAARLPGRESRIQEPPATTLAKAARDLLPYLSELGTSWALFGYCSGAYLALELVRQIRDHGGTLPVQLVVATRTAETKRTRNDQPDISLRLRELGMTDSTVLENPELLELLRPAIEADFAALDAYSLEQSAPLTIPMTVVAPLSIDRDAAAAVWQTQTIRELRLLRLSEDAFDGATTVLASTILSVVAGQHRHPAS